MFAKIEHPEDTCSSTAEEAFADLTSTEPHFRKEWVEPSLSDNDASDLVITNLDVCEISGKSKRATSDGSLESSVSSKKRCLDNQTPLACYATDCSSSCYSTDDEDPFQPLQLGARPPIELENDAAFLEAIANFNMGHDESIRGSVRKLPARRKKRKNSRTSGRQAPSMIQADQTLLVNRHQSSTIQVSSPLCTPKASKLSVACDSDKRQEPSESEAAYVPNSVLAMNKRFSELLQKSTESQIALEKFDRENGLPRSHCQTMVNSSRSRKQLQSGLILPKWNGKPLLDIPGAKTVGLYGCRQLFNDHANNNNNDNDNNSDP